MKKANGDSVLGFSKELIRCPCCGRPTKTLVKLVQGRKVNECMHCEKDKGRKGEPSALIRL